MTKYIGMNHRLAAPMNSRHSVMRIPRGLARLRALRLRLAAEKQPHLYQAEFRFSK